MNDGLPTGLPKIDDPTVHKDLVGIPSRYLSEDLLKPNVTELPFTNPKQFVIFGNSHIYYNNSVHNHLKFIIWSWLEKPRTWINHPNNIFDQPVEEYYVRANFYNQKPITLFGDITDRCKSSFWHSFIPIDVALFACTYLYNIPTMSVISEHIEWYKKSFQICRELNIFPSIMIPTENKANGEYKKGDIEYLNNLYTEIANECNGLPVPIGLAFNNYRKKYDTDILLNDWDYIHPSNYGTLLTSYTLFATYFKENPVGINYRYNWNISDEDLRRIQEIAWSTVNDYFG